jgi:hypothetical protein
MYYHLLSLKPPSASYPQSNITLPVATLTTLKSFRFFFQVPFSPKSIHKLGYLVYIYSYRSPYAEKNI